MVHTFQINVGSEQGTPDESKDNSSSVSSSVILALIQNREHPLKARAVVAAPAAEKARSAAVAEKAGAVLLRCSKQRRITNK